MVTIELAPAPSEEARALIAELDRVLSAEYPCEQRHGLAFAAIFAAHIRFFIARVDGVAAGCGGVAFYDGFAEVKRMFVRDDARGKGIAQALLARIERETREAGITILRIETGDKLYAALRLYERAGFRRRAAFGEYLEMDAHSIVRSVFLEKDLGAITAPHASRSPV